METEDDGTFDSPVRRVQTIVSPSLGDTIRDVQGRQSPTLNLGAMHEDHSDDEDTSSVEEAAPKKNQNLFPRLCLPSYLVRISRKICP